jgi:hypothetical protein
MCRCASTKSEVTGAQHRKDRKRVQANTETFTSVSEGASIASWACYSANADHSNDRTVVSPTLISPMSAIVRCSKIGGGTVTADFVAVSRRRAARR